LTSFIKEAAQEDVAILIGGNRERLAIQLKHCRTRNKDECESARVARDGKFSGITLVRIAQLEPGS